MSERKDTPRAVWWSLAALALVGLAVIAALAIVRERATGEWRAGDVAITAGMRELEERIGGAFAARIESQVAADAGWHTATEAERQDARAELRALCARQLLQHDAIHVSGGVLSGELVNRTYLILDFPNPAKMAGRELFYGSTAPIEGRWINLVVQRIQRRKLFGVEHFVHVVPDESTLLDVELAEILREILEAKGLAVRVGRE